MGTSINIWEHALMIDDNNLLQLDYKYNIDITAVINNKIKLIKTTQ